MKQKKVWRYYCEHCKKSGCSKWHIENHERGCTMNPNRICGMCKMDKDDGGDADQRPIAELIAALGDGSAQGLQRLRDLSNNCPACILAAIRQAKLTDWVDCELISGAMTVIEIPRVINGFDFKQELASWWADWNQGHYVDNY